MTFRRTFGGFRASISSARAPLPSCFKHYDRVLVGADRAKGRLLRCERRPPATGFYFKVKTDAGEWRWPDVLILDGPGANVATCEAGAGRFMTDKIGDGLLCPLHDAEIFGTREDHAIDAAADRYKRSGNTTKWKRGRR